MSRHHSPSRIHVHMYQPPSSQPPKPRGKSYVGGITAGVEDTKYAAKYKELKKKVKEIEMDNDRLYFKVLLAKKNIRRMNLERAILYERLASVPPTPGRRTQDLPAEDPLGIPQDHTHVFDPNDARLAEWLHTHPGARLVYGPDRRIVAVEHPAVGAVPEPPPYGIPLVHGFRHDSGPGFDPAARPPAPAADHPMEPPQPAAEQPVRLPPPPPHPHAAPHSHAHMHAGPAVHHPRAPALRVDLDELAGAHLRRDALPPVHSRSGSMSAEAHTERGRGHEIHDIYGHAHALPHPHVHLPAADASPSPSRSYHSRGRDRDRDHDHSHSHSHSHNSHSHSLSPSASRAGRIHNHQRVGPGANIHRERDPEEHRQLLLQREREREIDREREAARERAFAFHPDMPGGGYGWGAPDPPALPPPVSHSASRSDTPASAAPAYERRAYVPHGGGDERERQLSGPGSGRSSADTVGPALESRKRSRADMEVDGGRAGGRQSPLAGGGGDAESAMAPGDNRGGKRIHQEERSVTPTPRVLREEDAMDQDS